MELYVARDKDGILTLFPCKPYCSESGIWYGESDGRDLVLDKNLLPEVIFENSPVEVNLILTKWRK